MFCRKCGAPVTPGEKFCGSCGAIIESQESLMAEETPVSTVYENENHRKKNRKIGVIACILVGLVVISTLFFVFTRSEPPEKVVEKFITASVEMDFDKMSKYYAIDLKKMAKAIVNGALGDEDIADNLLEEFGTSDIEEIVEEEFGGRLSGEIKDRFEDDYHVTVEITDTDYFSSSEMYDTIEDLQDTFDSLGGTLQDKVKDLFDFDKIKEMCCVSTEITIEGKDDEDWADVEFLCVKMGGKWKVFQSH